MLRIANSIPLRRIRKAGRDLRYLAYRTFCSFITFEGTGGDAASKTLACKYGAVLQKIGLECIEFSVRLGTRLYTHFSATQLFTIVCKSYNHYTIHTGINLVASMEHAASTALLLSRQTSLLLLVLLTSCSGQSTYYVTPTPDTPCPGEPCHTLSEYAAGWHFQNNTTMEFLPGNHTLEQTMSLTNLSGLTLRGDPSSLPEIASRIVCSSNSTGFVFTDITGLHIAALTFISSRHNGNGLVYAVSVQQSKISNCAFQKNTFQNNSASGALYVGNSIIDLTINTFQNNLATNGGGIFTYDSIVNLTNNTFQNNSATRGGGIFVENSTVDLTGNTFQNNSAKVGGGLYVENSNLNLTGNTFMNNSAEVYGGGLYVENSNLNLTGNTFMNNSAEVYGGGLYVENSNLNLTVNSFQYNSADSLGGGLYVENSTLNLTGNTFQNNSAEVLGGGLHVENSNLNFTNNTFQNNSAEIYGGGLSAENSTLNLAGNTFQNNSAIVGGGLSVRYSNLNLTGNTFMNNSAEADGGGLKVEKSNLNFTNNTFQNNSAEDDGGGLSVFYSNLNLTNNTFQNNSAEFYGGGLDAYKSNLNLTENTFQNNSAEFDGGGLHVVFSTLNLNNNTFQNNSAKANGGGLAVEYNSNLNLSGNTFQRNSASFGGTLRVGSSSNMTFTDDYITESFGQLGGAIVVAGNSNVRMSSVVIENSRAQYGGGIAALDSKLELLERTIINNNTASFGGGLYAYNTEFHMNAIYSNNSAMDGGGGGIYASKSILTFTDNTTVISNVASTGGGLLLSGDSKLLLHSNMNLHLTSNHASKTGGAIKIEESNPLTYCLPTVFNKNVGSSDCFFQSQSLMEPVHIYKYDNLVKVVEDLNINSTIFFGNNSAVEAGADLYGGSIDSCVVSNIIVIETVYCYSPSASEYLFDVISRSSGESKVSISSEPLHICTCRDNLTDCTGSYDAGTVFPGGTIEVPVIAQGQRNGTTAAIVQVIPTPNKISHGNLEYSQNISSICKTLKYTIHSHAVGTVRNMALHAKGPCSPTPTNTLTVTVDLRHCPPGFQLAVNEPTCICAERLQQFTNTCLVDSATVLRQQNDEFWVGYGNDSESRGLIIHPHCPFDFCTTKETYLAVDDSDKQCNYNRRGLLCGRCSENLSLALGSSRCLQCSNTYLSLLAAFAFAGIALVLFLLVLRLTVAVGTVNGLIFYANIIAVNSKVFLQPQATNVLTVFIAWLNLDLGIETCFFNGMDAYVKTWLQFLFPLYVWALIGVIILSSYYSGRVAKVFGRNPMAVLATLFLLSYAKLLRTVIAALSLTYLEYPSNSQIAVWLYDGNIRYFSAKHIPLFTAAMVYLIFLFLPYTTLLIFGQWFQAKSHFKIFSCINNRYVKPFLDAYHAPYTDKHRYWTGLMLLLRLVLFLISAVNVLGDPSVNLLAVGSTTGAILPIILSSTIYKTWILGLLETSFFLNLVILCLASLYVRSTGGNQNAVTSTSVGIAFATFIGIVIYHSVQQIKGTRLWKRLFQRRDYVRVPLTDIDSGPEDPPDRVFQSKSAPTRTVVDMRELREACMATD